MSCNCGCNGADPNYIPCPECEALSDLEQLVLDAVANEKTELEHLRDDAKESADAAAESADEAAQSASEAKHFRDDAQTAANSATGSLKTIMDNVLILEESGKLIQQAADDVLTAIASIAVRTWYYTITTDGQTQIPVPVNMNVLAVQNIYIEGVRQDLNRGFTFDKTTMTITLARGLPKGLEITVVLGAYNTDSAESFPVTLASNNGASLVGTSNGLTVQQELNNNLLNAREQWRRTLAESGLTLVDGSFEEGATANNKTDAVWYIAGGQCYTWGSTFPRDVPAKSTPATTGGIGLGAWVSVVDAALRGNLKSEADGLGDSLLTVKQPFTAAIPRTQHDKNAEIISVGDFYGADPTGIQDSLVAFNSAAAVGAVVFVPKGNWLVSSNTDPATWLLDTGAYIRGLDDVGPTGTSINNISRLSGKIIQYGGSALTALRIGASEPWLEGNIRKFSESLAETVIKSSSGGIGALFASRSADNPSPNMQTIGSAHYGINDNIENPEPSWAAYLESVRYAGAGPAFGAEIDFVNLGNAYDFNPFSPIDAYSSSSAVTSSLWLSCGGGDSGLAANSNNISQAITLLPNAKKFNRGIVCVEGSIATREVVAAPNGYRYSWYKDAITQGSLLSDSSSIRKVWADNAFSFDSHYRYKPTGFATTPGDVLHQYRAFGYDGANDVQGVTVTTQQKTAFSSGNARFSWVVAVSNDDGGITDVGLNVNGIAQFTPASSDNSIALGSAANRWSQVYSGNGTINTSDGRDKTPPLPIDDAVLDAWKDVEFIAFQWLSSIQQKGEDSARWHFGVIAQQVRDAFVAHGLDGTHYGLLCYDEWGDEFEPVMAYRTNKETGQEEEYDTGEFKLVKEAGNRWGIRSDQCLFLEAAYQRRRVSRIEKRLLALESK